MMIVQQEMMIPNLNSRASLYTAQAEKHTHSKSDPDW